MNAVRCRPLTALRSLLPPVEREELIEEIDASLRRAAVLILLFPRKTGPSFLLTERPATLSQHPGQISLPGGAMDPEDPDLWHTAMRETREELGIKTGRIRAMGRLETMTVAVSRYRVSPFVGWSPVAPALHPEPREVAEVIEVPLQVLFDPATACEEIWELRGRRWQVAFYRFGDKQVWGATARILHDLSRRLQPGYAAPFEPGSVRPLDFGVSANSARTSQPR